MSSTPSTAHRRQFCDSPNYAPSDKKLGEKTTETTETTEKDDTRLRCCLSRLSRLSRLSHSLTELKLCASTRRVSPQAKRLLSNN